MLLRYFFYMDRLLNFVGLLRLGRNLIFFCLMLKLELGGFLNLRIVGEYYLVIFCIEFYFFIVYFLLYIYNF